MTANHATIEVASPARVRGRTIRFTWTDGPTAGKTHEHRFHHDGTVEWRAVGVPAAGERSPGCGLHGTTGRTRNKQARPCLRHDPFRSAERRLLEPLSENDCSAPVRALALEPDPFFTMAVRLCHASLSR